MPTPTAHPDAKQAVRRSAKAMGERDRLIVCLVYVEGFNVAEIAATLRIRPSLVRSRLRAINTRIRAVIARQPQGTA